MTTDTSGISKLDLKRQNRMHILRLLRNNGPTSRIDIAREIKITKAAVTIITNEMIAQGVLYEKGEMLPRGNKVPRGRKKILLDIDDAYRLGLGLTIDGSQLQMGLCTLKGRPVERQAADLPAGCSAGYIIEMIRSMYGDIAYKNDLKSGMVAGMGICISDEYFPILGIVRDEKGRADYSAFEKAMREFIDIPFVFGTLSDGIAMAEMDYRVDGETPPLNMIAFRCDRDLEMSVVIGRELYQGSFGRPGHVNTDHNSPLAELFQTLSDSGVNDMLENLYNSGSCPFLQAQALEDKNEFFRLFRLPTLIPEDRAVEKAICELTTHYRMLLECLIVFYAPDRIVFFGENSVQSALGNAAVQINEHMPSAGGPFVRRSRVSQENSYLAAASLATREFFINKGGY